MNPMDTANTGLTTIFSAISNIRDFGTSRSLTDVAKVARVEPLTLIDTDVANYEYTSDIMQSLLNIFAGYYLQAVAYLGNTIDNVSVAQKLAALNPNRSMFEASTYKLSSESYKYSLPTSHRKSIATENSDTHSEMFLGGKEDLNSSLKEAHNLSVGKMFNVTIKNNKDSLTVPVSIRLMVNSVTNHQMSEVFVAKGGPEYNLKERWHMYKSGRLSFIKDLILCRDLIDKQRKNLIKDKNDALAQISNNDNANKFIGLISKNPSLANASNLVVMSTNTASDIESKLNIKLKKFSDREALFKTTNVMILVVVDQAWDQVIFYHRGMDESSTVPAKSLKASSKGDNNVMDILTSFIRGSAPSI